MKFSYYRLRDTPILGFAKLWRKLDKNRKPTSHYLIKPVIIKTDGFNWIYRPRSDDKVAFSRQHEPEVMKIVRSQVGKGDIFFDVGAHVGRYTIRAAAQGAIVVAFEPNPFNCTGLRKNLSLNSLSAIVKPIAISDHCGLTNFNYKGSLSQITQNCDTTVPVTTLDVEVREDFIPKMIKIDVEGHEMEALRGGLKILQKFKPNILVEIHPKHKITLPNVSEILRPLRYKLNELPPYGGSFFVFATYIK